MFHCQLSGQCLKAIGSLLWWSIIANQVLFLLSDSRFVNNVETNSVEYAVKFVPVTMAVTLLAMSTQQTTHYAKNQPWSCSILLYQPSQIKASAPFHQYYCLNSLVIRVVRCT